MKISIDVEKGENPLPLREQMGMLFPTAEIVLVGEDYQQLSSNRTLREPRQGIDQPVDPQKEYVGTTHALARVAARINSRLDLQAVLESLCEETALALNVPSTSVNLVDDKKGQLVVRARYGTLQQYKNHFREVSLSEMESTFPINKSILVIPDIQQFPGYADSVIYREIGLRTVVIANIMLDGRLIGLLNLVTFNEIREFSDAELSLVSAFAELAAAAIQNARLFAQTSAHAEELEQLVEISSALRQADNPEQMLPLLANQILDLFHADSTLLLFNAGYGVTLARAKGEIISFSKADAAMLNEFFLGKHHSSSAPGEIFYRAERIQSHFGPPPAQVLRVISEMEAGAFAPLKPFGEITGTFCLFFSSPHLFTADEKHLLSTLAEMVGSAFQRAALMQTLEKRVVDRTRELTALYDLMSISNESHPLKELLRRSLQCVLSTVQFDSGCIYLFKEENALEKVIEITYPGRVGDSRCAPDQMLALVQRAAMGETILPIETPVDQDGLTQYDIHLMAPIRTGGNILGAIHIAGAASSTTTFDDIQLLKSMADQIGVTVENAHLHERAEHTAVIDERNRLARELHDSVTQSIYSLTLFAEAGRQSLEAGDLPRLEDHLAQIMEAGQQSLREMRLLIHELRPIEITRETLPERIRRRLDAVERRAGIRTRFRLGQWPENLPVSLQGELYGLTQEALNNALKHSFATQVSVYMDLRDKHLTLEIKDNGRGFHPGTATSGGGMGLTNMEDRARRLGGQLKIASAHGAGTQVIFTMELPHGE